MTWETDQPEDPEEAEALAAMRAAFGDADGNDGVVAGGDKATGDAEAEDEDADDDLGGEEPSGRKRALGGGAKGRSKGGDIPADQEEEEGEAKRSKLTPAAKGRAKKGDDSTGIFEGEEAWMQSEVDKLIGEVQRLAAGPFTPRLLSELWGLPLEEQHDVLLGATGTQGELLETQQQKSKRFWQLIQDEIRARAASLAAVAKEKKLQAGRGKLRAGAGASPPRDRSRSPSI